MQRAVHTSSCFLLQAYGFYNQSYYFSLSKRIISSPISSKTDSDSMLIRQVVSPCVSMLLNSISYTVGLSPVPYPSVVFKQS